MISCILFEIEIHSRTEYYDNFRRKFYAVKSLTSALYSQVCFNYFAVYIMIFYVYVSEENLESDSMQYDLIIPLGLHLLLQTLIQCN